MKARFNDFLLKAFLKNDTTINIANPVEEEFAEMVYKELATACAINIIANMVSKCEFRTYCRGEPIRQEEFFLWNIEPNHNQNSSDFIQKFITNLCYDNEALIVEINGGLYVADSFYREKYALYDDTFSNIVINNLSLRRTYKASEVIYCELNNLDIRRRLEDTYGNYGQTIAKAIRNMIRANGQKGILEISTQIKQDTEFREKLSELMNNQFRPFFEANSAVLPLSEGYKYTDVTKNTASPTPAELNERINYEFELAARAFRIPKAIMLGDVSDVEKVTKNFLTFAIDPLTDKLSEEITRKRYGSSEFKKGNFLAINTNTIQHIDIFEQAGNTDKLLSSGLYCIDELREKLGDTPTGEEWGRKHYITKNYAEAEQFAHLK